MGKNGIQDRGGDEISSPIIPEGKSWDLYKLRALMLATMIGTDPHCTDQTIWIARRNVNMILKSLNDELRRKSESNGNLNLIRPRQGQEDEQNEQQSHNGTHKPELPAQRATA